MGGFASMVIILKLNPSVKHRDWSVVEVRSHEYTRRHVITLLLISVYTLVVDLMIEDDVEQIVDTTKSTILSIVVYVIKFITS